MRQISYNVPLDGTTTLCQPPFTALGIVISNQTNQAATVTDGRSTAWTCPAGAAIKRQIGREADSFTARLAASATGDGCAVTFTADPVDDEGPAAIVGVQPPEVLIKTQANRAPNTYGDDLDVPADVRTLYVVALGANLDNFQIIGLPSLFFYLALNPSEEQNPISSQYSNYQAIVPIMRGVDSRIRVITHSAGANNGYSIYGLRRDTPAQLLGSNNKLVIEAPRGIGVTGPLTDAQLAARLPLSVSGPLTDAQLAARLPLAVAFPTAAARPAKTVLQSIVAAAGAGLKLYGPFNLGGYRGGYLVVNLSAGVGAGCTLRLLADDAGVPAAFLTQASGRAARRRRGYSWRSGRAWGRRPARRRGRAGSTSGSAACCRIGSGSA